MKKSLLILAAFTLSASAAAAPASFRYTADDLATLPGIAATHTRIEARARAFCRDYLHGVRQIDQWSHCVKAVTDEIVDGIGDARLTSYSRTGKVSRDLLALQRPAS